MADSVERARGAPAGAAAVVVPVVPTPESALPGVVDLAPQEGIRGLAAVLVVLGHVYAYHIDGYDAEHFPVVALDYVSPVTLFIILSGFTLAAVYDKTGGGSDGSDGSMGAYTNRKCDTGGLCCCDDGCCEGGDEGGAPLSTGPEKRVFFARRVARLLPLYYVGLLLDIPGLVIYNSFESAMWHLPVCLLGLQSFIGMLLGSNWNGPLWTASCLAFLYLLFPTLLNQLRRRDSSALRATVAVNCVLSALIVLSFLFLGLLGVLGLFMHTFILFRVPHFTIGISAGLLARRSPMRAGAATVTAELCSFAFILNLLLCACITQFGHGIWGLYFLLAEFVWMPPVFALWLIALASPHCQGTTRRALTSRPLQLLGSLSFALYCVHWPVLHLASWAVAGGVSYASVPYKMAGSGGNAQGGWFFFSASSAWVAVPLLLLACLAVAAAMHLLVEKGARARLPVLCGGAPTVSAGAASAAAAVPSDKEDEPDGLLLAADAASGAGRAEDGR